MFNLKTIIKFWTDFMLYSLKGGYRYYAWLLCLLFFVPFWAYGWYAQLTKGMIITGFNDQVSWGMYEANFVFLVGVAAAAVTVVFPAYAYKQKEMKKVVVLGEMLAITAVMMVMLFISAHMGRVDRAWHLIPSFLPPFRGIFNWPNSMLTWDVIVLNGYLGLNAVCAFYYLYQRYRGQEVNKFIYMPLVWVAIVWALSIHTVTAFLLNTLPARPMWFHSVMPIKFITTAFAAGPALIIIAFTIIRNNTKLKIADEAVNILSQIVVWCLGIALFLTMSEIVTELYHGTEHAESLKYLMFGRHGLYGLVPFFWASMVFMAGGFILLLVPSVRKNYKILPYICGVIFIGVWLEKGLGLVIPGFIPSPIGEFAEYMPTMLEMFIVLGNWAVGALMFTMLIKGAIGVLVDDITDKVNVQKVPDTPFFDPNLKLNRNLGRPEA